MRETWNQTVLQKQTAKQYQQHSTAQYEYMTSYHITSYHVTPYHMKWSNCMLTTRYRVVSYRIVSYRSYRIVSIVSYRIVIVSIISYHIVSHSTTWCYITWSRRHKAKSWGHHRMMNIWPRDEILEPTIPHLTLLFLPVDALIVLPQSPVLIHLTLSCEVGGILLK